MKTILYPSVGSLVGDTGKVLSIGYESYNDIDHILANVSSDRWYIVDLRPQDIPRTVGIFIQGDLPLLIQSNEYHHNFSAIVDYGVLGFMPLTWKPEAIDAHIKSYSVLLKPNGLLFLKWDLFFPKTNADVWDKMKDKLQEELIPIRSYLQIDSRCSEEYKRRLISKQESVYWRNGFEVNYNWTGKKLACDAYLHTQWEPKGL